MINKTLIDSLACSAALLLVLCFMARPVYAKGDGIPKRTGAGGGTRAVPEVLYHGALFVGGAIGLN